MLLLQPQQNVTTSNFRSGVAGARSGAANNSNNTADRQRNFIFRQFTIDVSALSRGKREVPPFRSSIAAGLRVWLSFDLPGSAFSVSLDNEALVPGDCCPNENHTLSVGGPGLALRRPSCYPQ